ncbi:dihydrofolate reductase family protein [Streptomyces sp. JJ38]|uniref:dihydrofolate reductase family protein n=1 Tax=Streptomyces sp. JJ38 TaxID=2738128 RepID=UPI001C55E1ED|nr:dihydrofolate reductase family protein [Streptomyces sp. JJ38]MBW1599985.1 hypothetical protein [Streptomyces sp. JJ38]
MTGRATYDPALRVGMTNPYAHPRAYVLSRSLTASPDPAVTVTDEDPLTLVRKLKAEDGPLDVYLVGGGKLAGPLLPEIDRLILKKYPVVAGAGLPAFDTAFQPTQFTLTDSRTFVGGGVVLTLDRA